MWELEHLGAIILGPELVTNVPGIHVALKHLLTVCASMRHVRRNADQLPTLTQHRSIALLEAYSF